jgi:hypothetical protein
LPDIAPEIDEFPEQFQCPAGRAFQPGTDVQEQADEGFEGQMALQVGQGLEVALEQGNIKGRWVCIILTPI